jgi:hypothetical protein
MMRFAAKRMARYVAVSALAFCVGPTADRGAAVSFVGSAEAAGAISPLDRLVAEDQIRQQIALYGFYADGDGVNPKDLRKMADSLMTQDVVSELYRSGGGEPRRSVGRDAIAGKPPAADAPPPPVSTVAGRHLLVGTYFDEVTPTTAKTRTITLHLDITKNMLGADCKKAGDDACGGRVIKAASWVYHISWIKTAAGWQISNTQLRLDT